MAVKVLKVLGQHESRRIEQVQLAFDLGDPKGFGKAMGMLASRSRKGNLKDVTVKNGAGFCLQMAELKWFQMLKRGEEAGWGKGVRRSLVVDDDSDLMRQDVEWVQDREDVLSHMHYMWGGLLVYRGMVLWEDYKQVKSLLTSKMVVL
jgi:hypothetical protein